MHCTTRMVISLLPVLVAGGTAAQDAAPARSLDPLPIRAVTVFKDGHSFVLREGELPVDPTGNVLMDDLPKPVLGTFWPFSADPNAKLAGVVAGRRTVAVERPALGLAELLRANVGAEATFQEVGGARWSGKIAGFLGRARAETPAPTALTAGTPYYSTVPVPTPPAHALLVETEDGTKAMAIDRIEGVTFKRACKTGLTLEEPRDLLTLQLAWRGERAPKARVGMVYLQSGLRWIPEYRIDVDGAGRAKVRLQATLVNDLADLDHAAVHLVVGVPRFEFRDTLDPMALTADLREVAARTPDWSRFTNATSNMIMSQSAGGYDPAPPRPPTDPALAALAGGVAGAGGNEDLFVFDLKDVSLARGERMTLAVAEFELPYTDVYTVEVAPTPPAELWQGVRNPADLERARELARPVAMHKLRLENRSQFPVTTAPAVILRDGRLLGQGRTSYTAAGGRCDVTVTQAIGLLVKKDDRETERTPGAVRWRNEAFHRVDLAGTLSLANRSDRAYEVEVTRHVLGAVDSADQGGDTSAVGLGDDWLATAARPDWWGFFNWPWWWHRLNGLGRITWKVKVEPQASVDLAYKWHYFWQ